VKIFSLQIAVTYTACAVLFFIVSRITSQFQLWTGLAVSSLMSLNVLGAVYPLYLFKKSNPITVYLVGMFIRVILLGFALALLYYFFSQGKLSFFLTAIPVYIIFQIIEIRHFIKSKSIFEGRL
jgi:hypothetical protein